jgi:hypothetical protein
MTKPLGRPPADNPRTLFLHIRVTDAEKAEIARLASQSGLTPAEYVRSKALDQR